MELQEVIDNLNNTIEGKENWLNSLKLNDASDPTTRQALDVTMSFVEINLKELRAIRNDLLDIAQ